MSLCYRVSQQHSLALSFGNNGCLSLSKADMELIYIFLVTRGFERLQEDHQDVTVNIPKKSHWKKRSLQLGSISVTTKNQQHT